MKNGRVQKKNRHVPSRALALVLDRESPARGYRHVVTKNDVRRFIDLLPDWAELSVGLTSVVLSRGGTSYDGMYCAFPSERSSVVHLSAWRQDLWVPVDTEYFEAHREVLAQLHVAWEHDVHARAQHEHVDSEEDERGAWEQNEKKVVCRFTSDQARAFMLLHVFLHELGHHHDWMTSRVPRATWRGESYAERFAVERGIELFEPYVAAFGDPRRGRD